VNGHDTVELHTASGSIYWVARNEHGDWRLRACNIPNPRSRRLDHGRWWAIRQPAPWPPRLGQPIELRAPAGLPRDDPERMPGGGKITSPIRAVRRRM